ncbi:hypothetical protein BTE77_35795 [Ensifer adhaerens]|nr:hypothetical protein BTE77_35795 [Ensifer adhaerens]
MTIVSEYREALQALKDQATSVTAAIAAATPGSMPGKPGGLADAQRRMSEHEQQVAIIVRLITMANKGRSTEDMITIPTLTESELLKLLWEGSTVVLDWGYRREVAMSAIHELCDLPTYDEEAL